MKIVPTISNPPQLNEHLQKLNDDQVQPPRDFQTRLDSFLNIAGTFLCGAGATFLITDVVDSSPSSCNCSVQNMGPYQFGASSAMLLMGATLLTIYTARLYSIRNGAPGTNHQKME